MPVHFIGEKGTLGWAGMSLCYTGTILDGASQAEYLLEAKIMKPINCLRLEFMFAEAWFFNRSWERSRLPEELKDCLVARRDWVVCDTE